MSDGTGRATVVYTAPPAPVINQDNGTLVTISIASLSSDFANNNPVNATIRLVPPGFVGPPQSALRPDFAVPTTTIGNPAVFQATVLNSAGADATSEVNSFQWTFGDGGASTGRNTTHTYTNPGTFVVSLTIVDNQLGRTQNSHALADDRSGSTPTATFVMSPGSPVVIGQTLNFNASGSLAEPGHNIVSYVWSFGDGSTGGGVTT